MIRKVAASINDLPPLLTLGGLADYYKDKDGVVFMPFVYSRDNYPYLREAEFDGAWLKFVPAAAFPHETWEKIQIATKEGKLGNKSEVRLDAKDSDSKVICVYVYDWNDKDDIERVKDGLVELGIMDEMFYFARIRRKTEEERRDEAIELAYGSALPFYKKIIRQAVKVSGISRRVCDYAVFEKVLLRIMISYPGGFDSPIQQQELFRITADEFKEHRADGEKLIEKLREAEEIAEKLLHTRIRALEEEKFAARLRNAKIGDPVEKLLCSLCNHPLEVSKIDKKANRVWVICPKGRNQSNDHETHDGRKKRHTGNMWIGMSGSPRDPGIFYDLAEMVLTRLDGLHEIISAKLDEKKQALMYRGRSWDSYNAYVVAQIVDAVKKHTNADPTKMEEFVKRFVSQLIST